MVRKLWRSWESDAIVEDAATGVYADFRKVHPIDHEGRFFTVRAPLNTAPAAEEPVMVQAGASGRGRDFAGKNSDVVLALASTPERMREHRDSIRRVATENGRDADAITVLFVVQPILTANAEETASVRAARSELTQAAIDEQLQSISYLTGVDFKRFDLDAPLPEITTNSNRGTLDAFLSSAPAGSTLREILRKRANDDGLALIGTADEVADRLGELGEAVGGDGFLFTGQVHPANVHRTLDPLVPVLRRRGLPPRRARQWRPAPEPRGLLRSPRWSVSVRQRPRPRTSSRSPRGLLSSWTGTLAASRAVVERAIDAGEAVYGLNRRLGAGRDEAIDPAEFATFQRRTVANHRGGIGAALPALEARAVVAARLAGFTRRRGGPGGAGAGVRGAAERAGHPAHPFTRLRRRGRSHRARGGRCGGDRGGAGAAGRFRLRRPRRRGPDPRGAGPPRSACRDQRQHV